MQNITKKTKEICTNYVLATILVIFLFNVPAIAQENKIDILFEVANSNSMGAAQSELQGKIVQFFNVFRNWVFRNWSMQGINVDLHIGVVTSDYGAGDIFWTEPKNR